MSKADLTAQVTYLLAGKTDNTQGQQMERRRVKREKATDGKADRKYGGNAGVFILNSSQGRTDCENNQPPQGFGFNSFIREATPGSPAGK